MGRVGVSSSPIFNHCLFIEERSLRKYELLSCFDFLKLSFSSGPTDIGMSRLTLSDADKQARDWFVETTKSLGCGVKVDAMGEFLMFAE
jgi:hypothetical protein